MKKFLNFFSATLVCLALNQTNAKASSHREAPLISNDPLADNTDLYAFRSPCDSSNIVLIANYIPFEHPAGGPNWYTFGENIRYEIHVDNNTATKGDDIIYRFTFKQVNEDPTTFFNIRLGKQNLKTTYTLQRSINGGSSFKTIVTDGVVPPPNIGPRSIENPVVGLGAANYDALINSAVTMASSGEKVFCGPADDPFFVDLGGAFDVGGFRNPGKDGLAKFNCHSICIEVPISTLQKDHKPTAKAKSILDGDFVIGVYASASRRQMTTLKKDGEGEKVSGDWIQVSRLGMPLTNEAVIPIGMKDKWNATSPANDLQFAPYFSNPELALYMDDSQFGTAVPGLSQLRIQSNSLGAFDFRNGKKGLFDLKGTAAVAGTALDDAIFGTILLPDDHSPRAVDLLPIFFTGVPNLNPYQLATGKTGGPLSEGKPFINNFLPTLGDLLRLNMAVPVTPRNDPKFSSLGIISAAVLGLTDPAYNTTKDLQFIPNMDGFPNGRRLEDDVTTIELQAVSGVALAAIGLWYDDYPGNGSPVTQQLVNVLSFNAGITHNDTTFKSCFPYVQAPWRGFNGPQYSGPRIDRLYVDASAVGGDGSTWAKAMKELSQAVAYANTNKAVKAIWVADGTYKPTTGSSRAAAMTITRADLKILGGFAGGEEDPNAADPAANPAIVSGDIGVANDASDNSYHLFSIHNLPLSASALEINGFTLEKGNANTPGGGNNYGGAIICYTNNAATSVKVSRSILRLNNALAYGGAVYADHADISFTACHFISNTSANGGAVMGFFSSSNFIKSVFAQNSATTSGGAVYTNYGTPVFTKVVFSSNIARSGGAIYQNKANGNYFDCLFSGNNASFQGGAIYQHNASNSNLVNSTLFSNWAANSGGAISLGLNASKTIAANTIFWKNKKAGIDNVAKADVDNFGGAVNEYHNCLLQTNTTVPEDNGTTVSNNLRGVSPMFANEVNPIGADGMWFTTDDGLQLQDGSPATNTGDNTYAVAAGLTQDINDNPRIACTTVDMGAYENQTCSNLPIAGISKPGGLVQNKVEKQQGVAGIVANPFTNDLQIRYIGNEKYAVSVSAVSGTGMWSSSNLAPGVTHVNTGTWSRGVYQVVLTTASGKRMIFKVMKM